METAVVVGQNASGDDALESSYEEWKPGIRLFIGSAVGHS